MTRGLPVSSGILDGLPELSAMSGVALSSPLCLPKVAVEFDLFEASSVFEAEPSIAERSIIANGNLNPQVLAEALSDRDQLRLITCQHTL